MDTRTPLESVVRTGRGERGRVSVSGTESSGRAIKPSPPDPSSQRNMDEAKWVLRAVRVCWEGLGITNWIGGLFRQFRLRRLLAGTPDR